MFTITVSLMLVFNLGLFASQISCSSQQEIEDRPIKKETQEWKKTTLSDSSKNNKCQMSESEIHSLWQARELPPLDPEFIKEMYEVMMTGRGLLGDRIDFDAKNKRMENRWKSTLQSAVKGADRIVVMWPERKESVSGSSIHIAKTEEKEKIEELVSAIEVNEKKKFEGGCRCGTGGIIAFYQSDERLAHLTLHHWDHLNWYGVWPDDGELTDKSKMNLKRIISENECAANVAIPRD